MPAIPAMPTTERDMQPPTCCAIRPDSLSTVREAHSLNVVHMPTCCAIRLDSLSTVREAHSPNMVHMAS